MISETKRALVGFTQVNELSLGVTKELLFSCSARQKQFACRRADLFGVRDNLYSIHQTNSWPPGQSFAMEKAQSLVVAATRAPICRAVDTFGHAASGFIIDSTRRQLSLKIRRVDLRLH